MPMTIHVISGNAEYFTGISEPFINEIYSNDQLIDAEMLPNQND